MRKILFVATLFLAALSVQAQKIPRKQVRQGAKASEKVMNVLKTDGTSTQTRVADLKQVSFLTENEGNDVMLEKFNNGALFRNLVKEVEEVTISDTTYNFTSNGFRILEVNDLCWPEDRLLPIFLQPIATVRSLDMNAASLSGEERVMFCTLQGIVNRTRPRILLYNHNEEPQSTWPTAHNIKTSAISTSSPYTLVKQFKDEINGLVLYSNERTNHYSNLAVTIAGLDRLLPVTAEIRAKLISNGMDFPVVEDLTGLTMSNALGV